MEVKTLLQQCFTSTEDTSVNHKTCYHYQWKSEKIRHNVHIWSDGKIR